MKEYSEADTLRELSELYQENILTKEEYELKKRSILNGGFQHKENKENHNKKHHNKNKTTNFMKTGYCIVAILVVLMVFFRPDATPSKRVNNQNNTNPTQVKQSEPETLKPIKQNTDINRLNQTFVTILQEQIDVGMITEFIVEEGNSPTTNVIVSDLWLEFTGDEKKEYANLLHYIFYVTLLENELIKDGEDVNIYIKDSNETLLAKPKLSDYN